MSFMFKPLEYDDWSAINRPKLSEDTVNSLKFGTDKVSTFLSQVFCNHVKDNNKKCVVLIDGYAGARFDDFINSLNQKIKPTGIDIKLCYIEDLFKPVEELEELFNKNLPKDKIIDPVLLFGKLYNGKLNDFFDLSKRTKFLNDLSNSSSSTIYILYGRGSATYEFRKYADYIVYIDVTPKETAIRARKGQIKNLGDKVARPFKELMRRNYYIDFEVILKHRKELLTNNLIDYYICGNHDSDFVLVEKNSLNEIFTSLANYPFRCKPVYMEGVWGGEFIRKVRKLPMTYKNIAWVFDLIPTEVSIVVDVLNHHIEFPFNTFVQKCPELIMGKKCTKDFDGYFPIRFNYDDTYHSNGNMSIQVHPDEKFCMDNYNEKGRQDESYYVVATGHGAKTYVGFKENSNPNEFIDLAKKSEKDKTKIDYQKYINSVESYPGRQILLPAGTIHASGRNQLILELGSLTVGSYTYKMYDYLRKDIDGSLRPIHTFYGEKVLDTKRNTSWVKSNLVKEPKCIRKGEGFAEYIVGEHPLMYYSMSRLEFEDSIEDSTEGQFNVLTLVDGEEVMIYSKENPDFCYRQKFLDVVVVPATINKYVIKNLGYQPVVIHKTKLKTGYKRYLTK